MERNRQLPPRAAILPPDSGAASRKINFPYAPLLIALIFTSLLLTFAVCQYETNDDMAMIRLLAGMHGLVATPDAVFLSLPLSALLFKLYQLAGNVPWYGLFLYGCLIIACTTGMKTIQAAETALANKITCGIAFLGFYSYLVCQLNFAAVSLFLWLTAITALASANLTNHSSPGMYLRYGTLLAISFLIRPNILAVSLIFSTPVIATFFMSGTRKYLPALLLPLLLALTISSCGDYFYRSTQESRDYAAFNDSRQALHNLHIGEPSNQTLDALAASGWSMYDYMLAGDWWLHDARIYNTVSITGFTSRNSTPLTGLFSPNSSLDAFHAFKLHILVIVLCLLHIISSKTLSTRVKGYQGYAVWGSLVITVGAIILMSGIRFPPRIAVPVFSYLVLLGTLAGSLFTGRQFLAAKLRYCIAGACIIAVMVITLGMQKSDYRNRLAARQVKEFTDATLQQVVQSSPPETILVTANILGFSYNSEAIHPLYEYRNALPILDFPGSWLIASPPYNDFLHRHGFVDRNQAVRRMIDNEKVLFAYWQSPIENFELFISTFMTHFKTRYGAEFPGKTLQTEIIFDNRGTKGNFGWIFFRISPRPQLVSEQNALTPDQLSSSVRPHTAS